MHVTTEPIRRLAKVFGVAALLGFSSCGTPRAQVPHPAVSATAAISATAPHPGGAPVYAHVVLAIFENHARSQVIDSRSAPYLTSLATHGADFADSFAIEHPSQPNYLDLFSGSNHGVLDDSCPHSFGSDNLAHQLIARGRTFKGYAEALPTAGSTVCWSGQYGRKHAPWTDFTDLRQYEVDQPLSTFPSDFNRLPTVSWVVLNLCDDMHDCSVATGDAWARRRLNGYAQWAKRHDSLLIVTFDEDDTAAGNRIATFFYGAHLRVGRFTERIDHFTVLRTLEQMYDLPALGSAAARTPITYAFTH